MNKPIEIPETQEYGWMLQDSGKRIFKPSKKSFWKRISFIVKERGGTVVPETSGFTVEGVDLDESDMKLIRDEMKLIGDIDKPKDIEFDKDGREQPNFDN